MRKAEDHCSRIKPLPGWHGSPSPADPCLLALVRDTLTDDLGGDGSQGEQRCHFFFIDGLALTFPSERVDKYQQVLWS